MKYLKGFNEAIVDYETDNIKSFYDELCDKIKTSKVLTFDDVKEVGDRNDIEVVDYDTFHTELPTDQMRGDAPPKDIPAFAMVNPNTHKARLILNVPQMDKRLLDFAYHMLKHENVHVGQIGRKKDKTKGEFLGDVRDTKAYFSNKDEVMAFSQSISDMIMGNNPSSMEEAMKMLPRNPIYRNVVNSVDKDILKRYRKYIFLYLEKEFEKKKATS
jgi:hypothetical protein